MSVSTHYWYVPSVAIKRTDIAYDALYCTAVQQCIIYKLCSGTYKNKLYVAAAVVYKIRDYIYTHSCDDVYLLHSTHL